MNRLSLVYRMDELLESCKVCPTKTSRYNPEKECKGCSIYTELRAIGDNLGKKKEKAKGGKEMKRAVITQEQYQQLKDAGLTDKQVAEKLGVSTATIWNYKNKWNKKPKQVDTAEKKPSEGKTSQTDKTAEFRALINELSDTLKQEKSKNEKLEKELQELKTTNEQFPSCEDLESEVASLKEEKVSFREQLLDTRHALFEKDYIVEKQKNALETTRKTLERYEAENKALRELVGLWI